MSDTFRFGEACDCGVLCCWVVLRYGERAAVAGVEEKRRALGRLWTARLAVVACSIVAAFMRYDRWSDLQVEEGATSTMAEGNN